MAEKLKLGKILTREEIVAKVAAKRPGVYRKVTWLFWETILGTSRSRIAVTKTMLVRLNIKYDNMKAVKTRKAAEDEALGAPKERRKSSYVHDKVHRFIVYDRIGLSKEFLQILVSNAMDLRTKKRRGVEMHYFCNGEEIDPEDSLLKTVKAITPKRAARSDEDEESFDTFVLPLGKIIDIQ